MGMGYADPQSTWSCPSPCCSSIQPPPLLPSYHPSTPTPPFLQHAYIVTFASIADRDYYNETDPAHQAFKALVGPKVSKVVVLDFEEGRF